MAFDLPKPLPSPFSVTITLPDELSTQVILGAISLVNRGGSLDKAVLASASFTITIGLAQMLDAIANQPDLEFEEEISIFPGSTEAFVPSPEKSEALLIRDTPILPKEIIPSEGLTLPPQIKPPSDFDIAPDRQPELPTFPAETGSFRTHVADDGTQTEPPDAPPDNPSAPTLEEALEDSVIDEPEISASEIGPNNVNAVETNEPQAEEPRPFTEPRVSELSSIEEDDLDLELATAALKHEADSEVPPIPENTTDTDSFYEESPTEPQWNQATVNIDQAFQKLQLRERFWQKLNLLTQDGYRQSLEVKRALHPSDTLPEGNQQTNEFVVYDPPRRSQWVDQRKQPKEKTEELIQVLPPTLDVPDQELVAGEWIAIKVRIPKGDYQPCVKVWMNDLQTRTIIDAPRLLMQFIPNDNNELETLMRVQVPSGCLELQFAAISIDMTTLQESRKVVQNRRVMPPDDSLSVFDDWDI